MMDLKKSDLKIETMRGTGPGGQHRNKTDSAVRITHLPTGISAYADERSQSVSKRKAMAELERRLTERKAKRSASRRKQVRDEKVKNPTGAIRTYNFCRGVVKDHRTGKTASVKEVVGKGRIELLR
ncbi:MAG: peptide chain release factor-like protein [Planctomycetota bacterium]